MYLYSTTEINRDCRSTNNACLWNILTLALMKIAMTESWGLLHENKRAKSPQQILLALGRHTCTCHKPQAWVPWLQARAKFWPSLTLLYLIKPDWFEGTRFGINFTFGKQKQTSKVRNEVDPSLLRSSKLVEWLCRDVTVSNPPQEHCTDSPREKNGTKFEGCRLGKNFTPAVWTVVLWEGHAFVLFVSLTGLLSYEGGRLVEQFSLDHYQLVRQCSHAFDTFKGTSRKKKMTHTHRILLKQRTRRQNLSKIAFP